MSTPDPLSSQDPLAVAQALGLELPSPSYIFFAIVFGIVGLVAFRLGRRRERPASVGLGLVLMLYPYVVGSTVWLVLVGLALSAGVWFDMHR